MRPSWRGEYELTDAMQKLVEQGSPVYGFLAIKWWKDTGRPTDLLDTNRRSLSEFPSFFMLGEIHKGEELRGTIQVDKDSVVQEDTKIEGPVVIGENCDIGRGCKISPYVEIGNGVSLVENVVLETVVMNNTIISNDAVLRDSIIGEFCQIGSYCMASGNDTIFGIVIGGYS